MAGHGAHVAVIEVDPIRALEALMDGYAVMTAGEAAAWGELFITATGNVNVFRREHFEAMGDGAIMANSGHFDAELDLAALRALAEGHVREVRENVQEFDLGGKKLNLIAEGRLVNLGAAEGHPAAVMDMSFANQALVGRVRRAPPRRARAPGLRRARGDRRRGRPAQARRARHRARPDDRRTGRVRGLLAAWDLIPSERSRSRHMARGTRRSGSRTSSATSSGSASRGSTATTSSGLEGRPAEGGRQALVRAAADGSTSELTPPPFNVRSRVHEYGGGSYVVVGDIVVFSDFADGRLYRLDPGAEAAVPITPDGPWRYADLRPDLARRRFYAVREDHSGEGEATNTIVTIPLDGGEPQVLVEGSDFVAAPRLSPDGTRLAWLEWDHPDMPWDATLLQVAAFEADGTLGEASLAAGGPDELIIQPEWAPDGTLHLISDRTGWWNLYRLVDGTAVGAARPDRGGVRRPALDVRPVELRVPARRRDRRRRPLRRARSPLPDRARRARRRGRHAVHRARVAARRCPRRRRRWPAERATRRSWRASIR